MKRIGLSAADRERLGGPEWYEISGEQMLVSEARALKKHTGLRPLAWESALNEADPDAMAFLIWLVRKRAGITEPAFDDLDFDLAALRTDEAGGEAEGNPPAPRGARRAKST